MLEVQKLWFELETLKCVDAFQNDEKEQLNQLISHIRTPLHWTLLQLYLDHISSCNVLLAHDLTHTPQLVPIIEHVRTTMAHLALVKDKIPSVAWKRLISAVPTLLKVMTVTKTDWYLFDWHLIPKAHEQLLKDCLRHYLNLQWVQDSVITKQEQSNHHQTISVIKDQAKQVILQLNNDVVTVDVQAPGSVIKRATFSVTREHDRKWHVYGGKASCWQWNIEYHAFQLLATETSPHQRDPTLNEERWLQVLNHIEHADPTSYRELVSQQAQVPQHVLTLNDFSMVGQLLGMDFVNIRNSVHIHLRTLMEKRHSIGRLIEKYKIIPIDARTTYIVLWNFHLLNPP